MKRLLFLSVLGCCFNFAAFSQVRFSEWSFTTSKNGVDFYSRWKYVDETEMYFQVKIVNSGYTKKYVSIDFIEYFSNGVRVGQVNGGGITVRAGETAFGERDGLWWTTPKGYRRLSATLKSVEVKDVD